MAMMILLSAAAFPSALAPTIYLRQPALASSGTGLPDARPSAARQPSHRPGRRHGHAIDTIIMEAAIRYQIHPALIAAIIKVESGGNPFAVSPKGAMGLMQLMPDTAKRLGVAQPFDLSANVFGGVRYLRQMLDSFNGNYVLALAAYNAGPQAVRKYGSVPPYYETMRYIPKVAHWYYHFLGKMRKAGAAPVAKRGRLPEPVAERRVWYAGHGA